MRSAPWNARGVGTLSALAPHRGSGARPAPLPPNSAIDPPLTATQHRVPEPEKGICSRARTAIKTECPRQTGPLARVSGRDSVPPAKRRWVPPSTLRHQDVLSQENRNDLVFRKVRGILNKLTPENFQKLSDDLLGTELNSSVILKGVILLIFEKALDEPKYSSMYAQLCKRLSNEAPNFESENHPCTFRLLLLNKCKAEFENRSAASEALDQSSGSGVPSVEEEERRLLAKRKMLGNIKFIGELAKLDVLAPSILHKCIQQLLIDKKRRPRAAMQDMSEDIECLCQILRTCGRILDNDLGQRLMVQYFERMKQLAECSDLPPRIRFMLKDVIELRSDGWVPRKATTVEGPMPINQIRPSDDDPRSNSGPGGVYMSRADRRAHDRADADRLAASELFGRRKNMRAGFEDMLASISLGPPSTNLIPTHSHYNPNGYGGGGGGPRDGSYRGHNNQRSGYIYGTPASTGPQRNVGAFNKHGSNNQHSNNSAQYNNASNKDLAPRFKKGLIAARDQNLGDLELRPAANSMLFNQAQVKAQVNSNMVMNSRLLLSPDLSIGTAANINKSNLPSGTPLLKDPLPIKQNTIDKPKQTKKDKGPNKEEVLKKLNALLDEYLQENVTLTQAVDSYKEHKVPDKYAKDAMLTIFNNALNNKTDSNREKIMKLVGALRTESLVAAGTCQEAIKNVCNRLEEGEREGGLERGAAVLCYAVRQQVMTLSDVATLTENGTQHPLFLVVLQRLHKALDKQELLAMFNASKVNLMAQLPEADRSKERLAEILEERELTFLYPLLRVQAEMARQLAADPTPAHFYKWIKENLEPASYTEAGFINALVTVLLKHVMAEAGTVGADPADKAVAERERALLERYTDVLQHFLHERVDLQVTAVYSLQAHCHALGFPKGLLLRWFIAFYDFEVVEEDAFFHWKEDLNDAYPGKGQALFQVHQWLTWLQEAESEDDEADD